MDIVKVQIPIVPQGGPLLVYNKDRSWLDFLPMEDLPAQVVAAAKPTGKAYFYVEETEDELKFGKQAPPQGW